MWINVLLQTSALVGPLHIAVNMFLRVAFALLYKECATALDGRETCCTSEMAVQKLQLQPK
jgi:hypothetical protein